MRIMVLHLLFFFSLNFNLTPFAAEVPRLLGLQHRMSATATVSFAGAPAAQSQGQQPSQGRQAAGATSAGQEKKGSKGASLVLPNEFLSSRLIGCRVVVFLTVRSIEVEGTLLEAQDDDTLLLGQAVVYRRPSQGCTTLQREVLDRFPKMAVQGRYVGMVSLKSRSEDGD